MAYHTTSKKGRKKLYIIYEKQLVQPPSLSTPMRCIRMGLILFTVHIYKEKDLTHRANRTNKKRH